MKVSSLFKTTTIADSPLDGSGGDPTTPAVSDFLTIQSLTNFAAMTGSITAAWNFLQRLDPKFATLWVPLAFAAFFGLVSISISLDGLKKGGKLQIGGLLGAFFIAAINSLVLASAVVGAHVATSPAP
jgi:hypothetical protein